MPVSQEDFDALAATVSQLSADLATVSNNLADLVNVVSGNTTAIGQLTADLGALPTPITEAEVAQLIVEAQPGYGIDGWFWPTVYAGGSWYLTEIPANAGPPEVADNVLFWTPPAALASPVPTAPPPRIVRERNVVIGGKLVKQRTDT
jgi:hypothetical protein